jgi:hypothetical protein
METGEMSIWDVFGVSRPSEREQQDVREIIASLKPKLPDPEPPQVTPLSEILKAAEPTVQRKALERPEAEPPAREEPPTPVNLKSQPPRPISRQHALGGLKFPVQAEAPTPEAKKIIPRLGQLRSVIKVRRPIASAPLWSKAAVKVRRK